MTQRKDEKLYNCQIAGSGMLRATISNLMKERQEELQDLDSQLAALDIEKKTVSRNKKANEGGKKRVVGEIQKLRNSVATINSQVSQVRKGCIFFLKGNVNI